MQGRHGIENAQQEDHCHPKQDAAHNCRYSLTELRWLLEAFDRELYSVAELEKRIPLTVQTNYCADLEQLQELLHFPEEVALRLADTEYQLFYQVRIFWEITFTRKPFSLVKLQKPYTWVRFNFFGTSSTTNLDPEYFSLLSKHLNKSFKSL